jgi:hypothetical protein
VLQRVQQQDALQFTSCVFASTSFQQTADQTEIFPDAPLSLCADMHTTTSEFIAPLH